MGYQNSVVYSDSLTAKAIPGTLGDAAVRTWQAGVDVALIVQTHEQTLHIGTDLETIIKTATEAFKTGKLNREDFSASIARIFDRKGIDACQL
jgi:hypothetical protein